MRTILLPTDFSPSAQNAVDYCIELYHNENVEFILLHALYLPYATPGEDFNIHGPKGEKIANDMNIELKRIHGKFPLIDTKITPKIKIGDLVGVVKFLQKVMDIYALAIGTKGAGRKEGTIIGSQTVAVIKNLDLPVFVIPDEAKFNDLPKILLTTDLLHFSGSVSLDPVLNLAHKYSSKITVLHVRKIGEKQTNISSLVKKEIHQRLKDVPHNFEKTIANHIATSINKYISEKPIGLVVTLSKSGNLFRKIFHKSISKQIALHTNTPLLVIHYKD